jgi:predicted nucleic acid-binding Zn ribbon protein
MAFTPAEEIIELLKRKLGLNENTFAIMQIWKNELGAMAQYAELTGFKNGAIYVECATNVHLHELTLRRRELIKKINQHFGKARVVKDIKLKLK